MKAYPIEDTIIAYFDGRLTDTEGAELLHRVSVSPEIREIFEAHDALRQMAVRAARNSSISPELEEAVFARVAALQEEERLPVGIWTLRRISATAGVAAIIIAGIVSLFEFQNTGVNSAQNQAISIQHTVANASFENEQGVERALQPVSSSELAYGNSGSSGANLMESNNDPTPIITMHPTPEESEVASIRLPLIEHGTLQGLRELPLAEAESKFEVGISSPMGGFSMPGSVPQQKLFSDVTIRAGYNFDEKNQVGVKITAGSFASLVTGREPGSPEFTVITGQLELQPGYAGELFYQHREAIEQGLFFVTGGAGGGIYSAGTLLSAKVGVEVPFGERLLGGVSLVGNWMHQKGSESAIMSSSSTPVIYDGPNIFNTLNGSIEYAITYKF